MLAWLSVWSEVQTCILPSWCHCHSLSLASVKFRLVLPFWYRLTQAVPEKGPLNGCVCMCVRACVRVCVVNKISTSIYLYLLPAAPTAANLQQWVCCCGPMLGQTGGRTDGRTKLGTDKDQCTRDIRSVDFNEGLNIWRELKLTDLQGDYSIAWQRVLRKTLIEMYNYWTADTTRKNDHECCLHETEKITGINANKTN